MSKSNRSDSSDESFKGRDIKRLMQGKREANVLYDADIGNDDEDCAFKNKVGLGSDMGGLSLKKKHKMFNSNDSQEDSDQGSFLGMSPMNRPEKASPISKKA